MSYRSTSRVLPKISKSTQRRTSAVVSAASQTTAQIELDATDRRDDHGLLFADRALRLEDRLAGTYSPSSQTARRAHSRKSVATDPAIDAFHWQVFFCTSYTTGFRLGDTRHLTEHDIAADRQQLYARKAQNLNEQIVPLPQAILEAL